MGISGKEGNVSLKKFMSHKRKTARCGRAPPSRATGFEGQKTGEVFQRRSSPRRRAIFNDDLSIMAVSSPTRSWNAASFSLGTAVAVGILAVNGFTGRPFMCSS